MGNNNILSDTLLTAIVPIVWGSTYIITTQFLPVNTPMLASVLRALPAGLILVIINRQLPRGIWWFRSAILGGLNIAVFFYCLFVAAYHLPGGIAALLMSTQPIIVLLYEVFLFGKSVRLTQIIACILAIVGVALVVIRPNASMDLVGVVAGLIGALSMASGIVLTKFWGRPKHSSLLTFTGWQLSFGGIFLLPFAFEEKIPLAFTVSNWLGFLYLGLIGALVTYALWFRGIERLPIISISFISLLSPLTATLLGYWFLDENLTWLQLLGGIFVIVSVILIQSGIDLITRLRRK